MDLKRKLEELYELHGYDLPAYAWLNEDDRWAELIFCLLNKCYEQNAESTRLAVTVLDELNLLDISTLANIGKNTDEEAVALSFVLKNHGFPEENAETAVNVVTKAAKVIQKDYDGKIQKYLRKHGEIMRDEMVSMFSDDSFDDAELSAAVSHWLQNVLSMPISMQNKALTEFCEENGTSLEELWKTADELDLSLAFVDDLIEMDKNVKEADLEDKSSGGEE